MIAESKALNVKVVELMRENNELIRVQNRLQAESANSLDNIEKNGVEIAA
jgi:hypothetical protein